MIDPNKLKSNGWAQQAEILASAVKSSKVHYEVPISYAGRTFAEGKKLKQDIQLGVVLMIIKRVILIDELTVFKILKLFSLIHQKNSQAKNNYTHNH